MHDCPRPERLADLLAGQLTSTEHAALEEHIEQCAACQEALRI